MPRCCAARGTRTKPARVQETQYSLVVVLLYVCYKPHARANALSLPVPSATFRHRRLLATVLRSTYGYSTTPRTGTRLRISYEYLGRLFH